MEPRIDQGVRQMASRLLNTKRQLYQVECKGVEIEQVSVPIGGTVVLNSSGTSSTHGSFQFE